MNTITISVVANDDLLRIFEIGQEAISPPWTFEALLSEVSRDDSFFAVAKANSQLSCDGDSSSELGMIDKNILGFVILRRMGDDGELLQIAVDRNARRRGVADLLTSTALSYSEENELKSVFLEVRESNEAAIALYKKHGFIPVHTRKNYYDDPVEDAVVMMYE